MSRLSALLSARMPALLLLLVAGSLLLVSLAGDLTAIGGYTNTEPRAWEQFEPALANSTHSMADLHAEVQARHHNFSSLNDDQKMTALYGIVVARFTHNDGARHTLFSNWLLFLAGKVLGPLGVMRDPELFLAKGHSLVCSQSSYLLLQLANQTGIRARHVGLNGHVVMEAWYDQDWHMFDPDAEVVARDSAGRVLGVEELSRDVDILRRVYLPVKGDFLDIFSSREDNSFVSYPAGAYFEWKAQVLLLLEQAAQILKYLLPLLAAGLALALLVRANRPGSC